MLHVVIGVTKSYMLQPCIICFVDQEKKDPCRKSILPVSVFVTIVVVLKNNSISAFLHTMGFPAIK